MFEPHTCEDCLKKYAEIVNLKKRIINHEFLYNGLSDLYESQNSDLFKDKEIKLLKVGFQLAIVEAIHTLNSPTPPRIPHLADTSANIHYQNLSVHQASASVLPSSEFSQGIKKVMQPNQTDLVSTEDNLLLKSSVNDTSLKSDNAVELT